ncbi:hypothetical protein EJ110_NYTH07636 [Nymphaea thermarum]|nr:hypothetical protein EJ110_NYTH07636 [Nymphaea thermarum]
MSVVIRRDLIISVLVLQLGGTSSSSGEMSPEPYWKKLLPRTPIPDSLQPFLPKDFMGGVQKNATVKNLKPGSKTKKLDFVKKEREGRGWQALLPRRTAEAFPFSVSKLDRILKYFSIEPTSAAAKEMKKTLVDCEGEANEGESRYCATSLESMVDFAISQLKTNDSTTYWDIPLVAEEDGSRVDAGAVCHTETSSWNPKHAAFQTLRVKPGAPIYHFLPYGHFAWVLHDAHLPSNGFDDPSQGKYATKAALCPIKWIYKSYKHGTTVDQLKEDDEVNFLFLEENLTPGSKTKKLDFVKKKQDSSGWPTLLLRQDAQAFPFSTSKLAYILKHLSMDPNSADASIVKQTLEDCEETNRGETRLCTTFLGSMVDFAASHLKTNDLQLLTYSFMNKEEREPKSRV